MKVSELAGLDALLSPFDRADESAATAEFLPTLSTVSDTLPTLLVTALPDTEVDAFFQAPYAPRVVSQYLDPLPITDGALLAALGDGSESDVVSTGVVSAPRLSWFYTSQLPTWVVDPALYAALEHFGVSITRDGDGLRLTPDWRP